MNTDKEFRAKIRQQNKETAEWENSDEGMNYNVSTVGDIVRGAEKEKKLIFETLRSLPKNVREKVIREVVFVMFMPSIHGHAVDLYVPGEKVTLIILNFTSMKNKSKKFKMTCIAHEIAHVILGHSGLTNDKGAERKTDNLCEKWGFGRAYKTYKWFE